MAATAIALSSAGGISHRQTILKRLKPACSKMLGQRLDGVIERQYLVDQSRNFCKLRDENALLLFFEAVAPCQCDSQ